MEASPAPRSATRLVVLGEEEWPEDVELVGETYNQDSFRALFGAIGDNSGGVLNRIAVLQAEPRNPHDRFAVAVSIDNLKVGYIPAELAESIQPAVLQAAQRKKTLAVPARVWARNDGVTWGARVTLSTDGGSEEEWTYAQRELLRRAARASEAHGVDLETASVRLEEAERASTIRGKNYSEWTTTIENWKRAERYDEALALLGECQCAAIAEGRVWNRPPAPWYFEQAAIIHRKRKEYAAEVAVLEAYMTEAQEADSSRDLAAVEKLDSRLFKARKLAERIN